VLTPRLAAVSAAITFCFTVADLPAAADGGSGDMTCTGLRCDW